MLQVISILAAVLTSLSFLPQTVKTIKSRDTSSISLTMYIVFIIGVTLWIIYGLFIRNIAILLANVTTLIFAVVILKNKIVNIRSGIDKG